MTHHYSGPGIRRRRTGPVVLIEIGVDPSADWPKVIIEQARKLGWRLINLNYRAGHIPDNLAPQGAILSRVPRDPLLRRLVKKGCSTIRLGWHSDRPDPRVPTVMHDLRAAGRLAADHFAERGFAHVGYVGRIPWSEHKPLYEGFKEGADDRGIECHLLRFESAKTPNDQQARYLYHRDKLLPWLRTLPKPLGLLAFGGGEAAQFCNICRDGGIAVPEDVAILSYGNFPAACECSLPTISSVTPDNEGMAKAAVDMLQRLMEGKTLAQTAVMIQPLGVVVRESTDLLAVADRTVAVALRHVWDHLDLEQSVGDVARHVGVSRRSLARGFRKYLDRGVAEERHRKRMEVLARLLRETDEPIADLAVRVGFRTLVYLHRSFRRTYGMTPKQYRKQRQGARE